MKRSSRNLLLFCILIGVIVALRFSGLGDYLTIETLQKNRNALLAFVHERYFLSVILYVCVYISVITLNLPGAAVLTIAGGYLFGAFAAVLFVNFGATTGAVLAFLSARYLLGHRIQEAHAAKLAAFNDEIARNGTRYLLTLRLIPVVPFFLVNFLSGLTRVPLSTFVWTTALGIVPGTMVFAFAGHQLASVRSAEEILSPRLLAVFVLLALFMLLPAVRNRFRKTS